MTDGRDQFMTPSSPLTTTGIPPAASPLPDPIADGDDEFMTPESPSSQNSADSLEDPHPFPQVKAVNFNNTPAPPGLDLTENLSPTFHSTGNPCLDLFFHAVPSTPAVILTELLNLSWTHDPLTTLKLVCNLRGVRGTGKSDKKGFYTAAAWLHSSHPKTLACNVGSFAEFGYFKDLPEILYRLLEGPDVREVQERERKEKTFNRLNKRYSELPQRGYGRGRGRRGGGRKGGSMRPSAEIEKKRSERNAVPREERIAKEKARVEGEMIEARKIREQNRVAAAKKATDRYDSDQNYRFLHDQISNLFAECLKSDVESLNSGKLGQIGLAAKWCPSLDYSFDRSTLLCQSIARRVFPTDAENTFKVRDRLRREVLVPLRRALELPEVFMSANRWNELPYNRVASVAMTNYKKLFVVHDEERFKSYLESVKRGEKKIAAGALLPHEVIKELDCEEDGGEVAELQWNRIVEDLSKVGTMKNCIAVCDVSGSMYGIPMEVSVALGLLVSELSEEPWKGKVITFSAEPKLNLIVGESLKAKTEFIRKMDWGMNTDFQAVFDRLLEVAVEAGLKEEEMIKRVFVFSDMEFDEASANPWETDYEAIKRKFNEKGYGNSVPEIVFWNLRDSRATPVKQDEEGVGLVSGFSKNLLKMFLENGGAINPVEVMEAAISGKEYQKLVVFD